MLQVGELIAGKFRVDRLIGRGGMGIVVAATHIELDQRVAVKVLDDEVARDPQSVERLLREARACANLRSEHSCRVIDVGRLDSGAPYIVMELLEGADLTAVGRLPLATAAGYVVQACVALAEAHGRGIVHRDLKPGNLFVTRRLDGSPLVKVLDFGIAKAPLAPTDVALTRTAALLGTPRYMAPEQLRSARDVDARTDIWGLGVILYELVSGRPPFPAETLTELAVQIAVDPPQPLDVDAGFGAIISRCLAKAPEDRYADVGALAAALAAFAGPDDAKAAALAGKLLLTVPDATLPSLVAAGAPTASTLAAAATALPAAPPRKPARLALAIGGVIAVAAGAFVVLRSHDDVATSSDHRARIDAATALVPSAPFDARIDTATAAIDARIDTAAAAIDARIKTATTPVDAPVAPIVTARPPAPLPAELWASAVAAAATKDCKAAALLGMKANAAGPEPAQAARLKTCFSSVTDIAWDELNGDYRRMRVAAELAIAIDGTKDVAHKLLAEAACRLKDARLARQQYGLLIESSRGFVAELCHGNDIDLH